MPRCSISPSAPRGLSPPSAGCGHWPDVAPAEQPALFMAQKSEIAAVKTLGAPTVWTLLVELYLYAHSSDPYRSPATVLNPLVDAVEAALAPAATTGLQDLGLPSM